MEVIILPTPNAVGLHAARLVSICIRSKPHTVIGLATGSTPLGMYEELVRMHREEKLDWSGVTTFNLDEYVGLGSDHPASYASYMRTHLFQHVNMDPNHIHIPDGLSENIPATCADYEKAIVEKGGIDLQVLGLGVDGHIGFNEPSSSLASRTRIKTLTQKTLTDNQKHFASDESQPRHVITMGVGTIMATHHAVLLAFGEKKADAVAKMTEGPVTAMVPASILQHHPKATILIDEAAAAGLKLKDYYRYVHDHKPAWQRYVRTA